MFKRDLRINFSTLDQLCSDLYTFGQALDEMNSSINALDVVFDTAKGEAIEALRTEKQNTLKNITEYKEQVDNLLKLISNYVSDMTHYIKPVTREREIRVDRNDIWANLTSINWAVNGLTYNKTRMFESYVSQEEAKQYAKEIQHNEKNLMSIQSGYPILVNQLKSRAEKIKGIYEGKINPYENTDDDYAYQATQLHIKYSNFWEITKNLSITSYKVKFEYSLGSLKSITDFIVGVLFLARGLPLAINVYAGCGIIYLVTRSTDSTPDWAKKVVENTNDTIDSILYDPILILEGMSQNNTDEFDEKGIFYAVGYIITEIAISILLKKWSSKLAGKADDVGNSGNVVNKVDDVTKGAGEDNWKVNKSYLANEANTWWKEQMGYDIPTYRPGTTVEEIILSKEDKFVRVYDGTSSHQAGGWMMKAEDIKGLSPKQIQDKFALPTIPKYVTDVTVPKGTTVRTGTVNAVQGWGSGGGIQFDLIGQRIGKFTNERLLK